MIDELDFTIELNSDLDDPEVDGMLLAEADNFLRDLAEGHSDLTGAAVTVRLPAKAETPPLYEVTVVAYVRPENIAATAKQDTVDGALKRALDAVERQLREKRAKLRKRWERPEQGPVAQEVAEVTAAEDAEGVDEVEEDLR
jgi:ribosome-associated translation inhibitor RaiA